MKLIARTRPLYIHILLVQEPITVSWLVIAIAKCQRANWRFYTKNTRLMQMMQMNPDPTIGWRRAEHGTHDSLFCNCSRIEDETHFLLDFPSFSSIREMLFSKLEPKIPFLRLQSQKMNSTDYFINIQLISFISSCFELRDKLVSEISNPTDGWK